jgi:hypothetical protein
MNCNTVNIVWIERGIILIIIYNILENYNKLKNKKIYLSNKKLIVFFSYIFSELKFIDTFTNKKNIYIFNIRNSIYNSGVVIDYLSNYSDFIPTNKIWLVPYYDMNDPLIMFEYNMNKKLNVQIYDEYFKQFSNCYRGNYMNKGIIWDILFENYIIKKADKFGIDKLYFLINNFVNSKYTDTIKTFYYPLDHMFIKNNKITKNKEESIKIIHLMNQKINELKDKEHQINELNVNLNVITNERTHNNIDINFLKTLSKKIKIVNSLLN